MLTLGLVEAALAVGAASLSLSKGSLFKPFHAWTLKRSKLLNALVTCPFCLAHWFAAVVALFLPQTGLVSYALSVGAIIMLASLFAAVGMKLFMWDVLEIEQLRDENDALEAKNADLLDTLARYRERLDRP